MAETTSTHSEGREVRVLDAGALKALAHPIRVAIYDMLSQFGPQTASTLATRLGESSGATSYHLRALAKQNLIREVPGRGTARERWWERPEGSVAFDGPEAMRTPSGRAASQLVMSAYMTRRNDQLLEFLQTSSDGQAEEWQDAALISTASARMTGAQLRELGAAMMALIDDAVATYRNQEGDGVRPVTIRADLFPIDEGETS